MHVFISLLFCLNEILDWYRNWSAGSIFRPNRQRLFRVVKINVPRIIPLGKINHRAKLTERIIRHRPPTTKKTVRQKANRNQEKSWVLMMSLTAILKDAQLAVKGHARLLTNHQTWTLQLHNPKIQVEKKRHQTRISQSIPCSRCPAGFAWAWREHWIVSGRPWKRLIFQIALSEQEVMARILRIFIVLYCIIHKEKKFILRKYFWKVTFIIGLFVNERKAWISRTNVATLFSQSQREFSAPCQRGFSRALRRLQDVVLIGLFLKLPLSLLSRKITLVLLLPGLFESFTTWYYYMVHWHFF